MSSLQRSVLSFVIQASILNLVLVVYGTPAPAITDSFCDESSELVCESSYLVNTNTFSENGRRMQQITVTGNGVSDCFKLPSTEKLDIMTLGSLLIVGDPIKNSLCLFSDKPSLLVVIKNGICTRKSYTTNLLGTTCSSSLIPDSDCRDIIRGIMDLKRTSKNYWSDFGNTMEAVSNSFIEGLPFQEVSTSKSSDSSKNASPLSFITHIGKLFEKTPLFKFL